jgi:fumarylacetoacetate (FAA) hydrolase
MKLGTLRQGGRDGLLVVASSDLSRGVTVPSIAPTLQAALDAGPRIFERLQQISDQLNRGQAEGAFALRMTDFAAPLPRAYQWLDASAYLSHVERVRKARGASMPPSFAVDPIMYQGGSDLLLGPHDPIVIVNEDWGADFEAEIAVIIDDVPLGCGREQAAAAIRLIVLLNDVSLRGLIPAELAKGFGFVHGKPSSAFAPFAVTPDELGDAWDGSKLHLEVTVDLNGNRFGTANAGMDMQFDFPCLIMHAAKTRGLSAGTIIGAGTVSNHDRRAGCCCIAELRALEMIDSGEAQSPFLRHGDHVRIELRNRAGATVCGAIDQFVTTPAGSTALREAAVAGKLVESDS